VADDYIESNKKIAEEQLVKAGIRLSEVLNRAQK